MSSTNESGVRPIQRRFVTINGVELAMLEAGSGPSIVLVHGSVTTSELFRETLAHFSDRYHLVAVDLRGYGHSQKPGFSYTMKQFSDDLLGVIEAMQLQKTVLLGVSMGGFVAQRFALDYPERLAGLVLCATSDGELAAGLIDEGDVAESVKRVGWRAFSQAMITGAFPPATNPSLVQPLIAQIDTWNEQVIVGVTQSIKQFSTRDQLHRINVPTLLMAGGEDQQLPVSFSQRMAAEIQNSQLEVFDGVGHFMMIEDPARFHSILETFLAKIWKKSA
ncbi:MAG: alpha/beta hydrolase [Burkholderiaceae bacterium]